MNLPSRAAANSIEWNEAGGEPVRPAFAALYAEHFAFVWRCLQGLGVPSSLLEDAAQDVFMVVHRRLPDFEERSELRTWIFGIARNVAFKQRRTLRRRPTEPLEHEPASLHDGPQEHAQEQEAAAFLMRFVATLDERQRELFVSCVLERMAVTEVAQTLGVPLNTAYARIRTARDKFRRALARRQERHGRP